MEPQESVPSANGVDIKWFNAVIDLPADVYPRAESFWSKIANATLGTVHPEHPEYRHLVPPTGNMVIELQRIDSGPIGVHLDLVVEDIDSTSARAQSIGATLTYRHPEGHHVLRTPGGSTFCVVPWGGEASLPPAIDPAHPHAIDQICLDIPHGDFDREIEFWNLLTGWSVSPAKFPEFRSFDQPSHLPLRLLIQRLGEDDTAGARAHLDISSGDHVGEVTAQHVSSGAARVQDGRYWSEMVSPGGLPYCVTSRQPDLG